MYVHYYRTKTTHTALEAVAVFFDPLAGQSPRPFPLLCQISPAVQLRALLEISPGSPFKRAKVLSQQLGLRTQRQLRDAVVDA